MILIDHANAIIEEYQGQGFMLTLRQLYYQFVARDLLPNTVQNYKRLGSVVNDARLAGLIDWNAIEDRTRNLAAVPHWDTPANIIDSAAYSYRIDKWATQPTRVEVWIEKEALAGVFARICSELDVPYFACRGYTSQSEMWTASERLKKYKRKGQRIEILHFGDHDPSGIDMTRDIIDRLNETFGVRMYLTRLALNMDQVRKYKPPPNPAKETDSRFDGYLTQFGSKSWELDALEPKVFTELVRSTILDVRDESAWSIAVAEETKERADLQLVAENWTKVSGYVDELKDGE